jgi:hypothetical protein
VAGMPGNDLTWAMMCLTLSSFTVSPFTREIPGESRTPGRVLKNPAASCRESSTVRNAVFLGFAR